MSITDMRRSRPRRVILIAVALAALLAPGLLRPNAARAYECVNHDDRPGNHCYGVTIWGSDEGRGTFAGGATTIQVPRMTYNTDWQHITAEMWVVDGPTGGWIEIGVFTGRSLDGSGNGSTVYFWADNRPNLGYIEHNLGNVPNGNYGYNTDVEIYRDPYTANQYHLYMRSSAGDVQHLPVSTNNSMQPSHVHIGQELYGRDGGISGQGRWSYNKWIGSDMVRHYQGVNGNPRIDNPPFAGWGVNQAPSQTGTGGNWYADCC